jgi:hypothetical protein
MKKLAGIVLFLLVAASIFAEEGVADWVNECISLLGKAVPKEFERAGRDAYRKVKKGITISVYVKNNLIWCAVCASVFNTTDKAARLTGEFYDYLEKNNWEYLVENTAKEPLYLNGTLVDGIYATIATARRDDGGIVALIAFFNVNDMNYFMNYFK